MGFLARPRISERSAHKMIVEMALHGNHYNDIHGDLRNVGNIKEHLRQNNYSLKSLTIKIQTYSNRIPIYENLIGAQWKTKGVTISRPNHITGEMMPVSSGDGTYNESDYWASFELSLEDFEAAIKSGSPERFLSAVNSGIASIEAFLNQQYMIRCKIREDHSDLKKDLEFKIKSWPELIVGTRFDLSGREWNEFVRLKKLRDDSFQHRKSISSGLSDKELLQLLNTYKLAVPKLLFNLHIHTNQRCPSAIIRASYYPEIVMDVNEDV